MSKNFLEKKPDTMLDWMCLTFASIAFYLLLNNIGYFVGGIQKFLDILSPFAGGVVLAYVLNPMVNFFEEKLLKNSKKFRWVAILLAYAVAVLVLFLLAWMVIPQIVASVMMLFNNFSTYASNAKDTLLYIQETYAVNLDKAIQTLSDTATLVNNISKLATDAMPQILASIGSVASNFVGIFTAVSASAYMQADRDHLLHQLRTVTHALLPRRAAEQTLRICHYANDNFTGFFIGKIIDSAIIGVITFVCMTVLRLDFAVLISVFIGITNIIPVFGPFIGAVPSIFILLLVNPIQALIFCILILIIQQFDGNFIGPKILGQSIGISALWVLFSIIVGGDLFGLVGMIIGVPVFATLYGLMQELVQVLLAHRGIDSEGNDLPPAPETENEE